MGLRDGPAPCKCMHGQPGVQGPPGPKVAAKTPENLHEQHTMNLLSLPVSFICRVTEVFPENLQTQEDKETG